MGLAIMMLLQAFLSYGMYYIPADTDMQGRIPHRPCLLAAKNHVYISEI